MPEETGSGKGAGETGQDKGEGGSGSGEGERDHGAGDPGRAGGLGSPGDTGGAAYGGAGAGGRDIVERVLSQWQRVRPELDTAPMGVVGRINRCAALLQQASDAPLAHEGFTRAEFDILGTLRREDQELTPGQIARETFASGAAVTKRVRLLEEKGLVERRPGTRDRRVAHLSLTPEGLALIDRLMPDQLAYERSLLDGLRSDRRDELADVLGDLLLLLEGRAGAQRSR